DGDDAPLDLVSALGRISCRVGLHEARSVPAFMEQRKRPAAVEADVRRGHPRGQSSAQISEFEQRQLRAIREELNRTHAQRVAPAVASTKPVIVPKIRKGAPTAR